MSSTAGKPNHHDGVRHVQTMKGSPSAAITVRLEDFRKKRAFARPLFLSKATFAIV
jgi:hypothetical protein